MHLASARTRSRRGIVPIIAPRGMVEVNYKITVIRDDRILSKVSLPTRHQLLNVRLCQNVVPRVEPSSVTSI
jgi:hypothetical protein